MGPPTRSGQTFHKYKTRQRAAVPVAGARNTDRQERVIGIDEVIDRTRLDNIAAVTEIPDSRGGGYVQYRAVVSGQRGGVEALLTPQMLRTGSAARYEFPFFRRLFGMRIVRGHLLAKVLGGSGVRGGNLVPLPHHATNLPMYADIEKKVRKHLGKRFSAKVEISVEYVGNSVLPSALIYKATDAKTSQQLLGKAEVRIPVRF